MPWTSCIKPSPSVLTIWRIHTLQSEKTTFVMFLDIKSCMKVHRFYEEITTSFSVSKGCPNKNAPVAYCSSRLLVHFYWDTLYIVYIFLISQKKILLYKVLCLSAYLDYQILKIFFVHIRRQTCLMVFRHIWRRV